ncbi:MAG: TonB-dependent receptor [Flavobacteriaceae bacterium]|nr:TonB-dependent receptor [Flavobacteriaceae bacterium]
MKNSLRKGLLLFCAVLGFGMAHAQSVSGTVSDANGPLPGANVLVKGTTNGTQTDFDGNYSLSNVPANAVLVYSYIGFKSAEVAVGGRTTVNITLEEDAQALEEVVLVGYGAVRKKDATGAVASVKAEDFNKGITTSADQLLQGRVSGVQITSSSGEPGAAANIRIRGTSSIRGGNEPLIVLDGVPLSGGGITPESDAFGGSSGTNPLNFINSADIESIDVLKDASATAIYGSRGANGVILITTKSGKSGKPQISYSSSYSFANRSETLDVLKADDFPAAAGALGFETPDLGARIDPFNNILQTAFTQTQDVSISGGSETGNYRFSVGYLDQEGVIKNTGQEKYTTSLSLGQNAFNDRVKFTVNTIASFVRDDRAPIGDNAGAEGDLISSAIKWNPTRSFFNPDGSFLQLGDNQRNPLAMIDFYKDLTETTRIFTNLGARVKIIEGLSFQTNIAVDHAKSDRRIGISRLLNTNDTFNRGRVDIRTVTASNILFENTITWDKEFTENYKLNFVAGYSYQLFEKRGTNTLARDFLVSDPNKMIKNLGFAETFRQDEQSSFEDPKNELQSYFGRANVTFFDKYLLTATLRVDGSSRFGSDEQYGYFPSVGAAWQIHKEGWLPDYVSDLKLRAGWGITGNQEFGSGLSQNQFGPADNGATQTVVGNNKLQWEETTQLNLGLDFGILNDRFTASVDYYYKETTDILFRIRPRNVSPNAFQWVNLDDVAIRNQGVDITLKGDIIDKGDFKFSLAYNMSFLENELNGISKRFSNGLRTGVISGQGLSGERGQLLFDGQSLFSFYIPIFEGFDANGNSVYRDVNGDGIRSTDFTPVGQGDRAFVGDPNPDITIGIQANFSYKKWDLSAFFNGAYGAEIFDNTALQLFNTSSLARGENVTAETAKSPQNTGESLAVSTRFLKSGDFLRLNNLTLGYTFDSAQLKQSWINSLRLTVTGQNLFVITPYDGFDPEVNISKSVDGVPSFGIDATAFPRATSVVFGLTANF